MTSLSLPEGLQWVKPPGDPDEPQTCFYSALLGGHRGKVDSAPVLPVGAFTPQWKQLYF